MTPDRFRECLTALHWTQRGLARILGQPEGLVRQWARGARPVPQDVADWLESFVKRSLLVNRNNRPFPRHQENG